LNDTAVFTAAGFSSAPRERQLHRAARLTRLVHDQHPLAVTSARTRDDGWRAPGALRVIASTRNRAAGFATTAPG